MTSRAAPDSPGMVCEPPAADTHTDGSSLFEPEQGDELSDAMMAKHMSIKER